MTIILNVFGSPTQSVYFLESEEEEQGEEEEEEGQEEEGEETEEEGREEDDEEEEEEEEDEEEDDDDDGEGSITIWEQLILLIPPLMEMDKGSGRCFFDTVAASGKFK